MVSAAACVVSLHANAPSQCCQQELWQANRNLCDLQMMPGLPTRPAFFDIDIDCETGKVLGLS